MQTRIYVSRRAMLLGMGCAALSAMSPAKAATHPFYGGEVIDGPQLRDEALFPPPESPIDFEIEPVDPDVIAKRFRRQEVPWEGFEEPGTIVIDPGMRYLYLVQSDGYAIRYGVGVGRQGFAWSGEAQIGMKRRWPRWLPPEEMVYRDAKAMKWVNGMPGGPENPLGARALYLNSNGQDTLYRIHGTNDPKSIGKAMSSGCIRMLNEDVADLFDRVKQGTKVIVLEGSL
jgi:lipoprotein-anchoring transpeptidase ErfK/SrfK